MTAPLIETIHRELFSSAGYSEIVVKVDRGKGWICAIGKKPLGADSVPC